MAQHFIPGATGCCGALPPPDVCNDGGSVDAIQQIYTDPKFGLVSTPVAGQPSEGDLIAWLSHGPVQVFWINPGVSHVALIVGVQQIGEKPKYTVNDPWPVGSGQLRTLTFDQLVPTIPSGYKWKWQCVWHA